MRLREKKEYGFTLAEILISISLFMVVMTISMGSLLGVFGFNRKAQTIRAAMGNLNFAVETMVREIRFGKYYFCGSGGSAPNTQDCNSPNNSTMSFRNSDGEYIVYKKTGNIIEKSVEGGSFIPITAGNVSIDNLEFFVIGSSIADDNQPKVLIKITGHAGGGTSRSDFTLQTLATQRTLDIPPPPAL